MLFLKKLKRIGPREHTAKRLLEHLAKEHGFSGYAFLKGDGQGVLTEPCFGLLPNGERAHLKNLDAKLFLLEREETKKLRYQERERKLKEHNNLQKEALIAKLIYHTHHKAEKVMGFINEDLSALTDSNAEQTKYKVTKYANFISRVIYDMKWYDPPVQTIRNPIFRINLNELIEFIVNNIFLRVSNISNNYEFKLDLDKELPIVNVNEFVIWEIIEPLIQNAIDHSEDKKITIFISTKFLPELKKSELKIADDGSGISQGLLEEDENGIKQIFLENVTTKQESQKPSGYGCYIAHEIATQRCGWSLDVRNLEAGGCEFTVTIPHY